MARPEIPTNPPSESLKVDATVVDPAQETDLPTGEPVTEHTFGPSDVETFPSEQCPHDIVALGSCLVLAPVELSDVLGSHQTGDAVDVSKPNRSRSINVLSATVGSSIQSVSESESFSVKYS